VREMPIASAMWAWGPTGRVPLHDQQTALIGGAGMTMNESRRGGCGPGQATPHPGLSLRQRLTRSSDEPRLVPPPSWPGTASRTRVAGPKLPIHHGIRSVEGTRADNLSA